MKRHYLQFQQVLTVICVLAATVAGAAEWTVKRVEKAPPKELAKGVKKELSSAAIQVSEGDELVYEFWFNEAVPLKSKPSSLTEPFSAMEETTLLGAASVHQSKRDYRDSQIYKGVYTMRYTLKPQDGNHLGTSDYPYFALLVPAKRDRGGKELQSREAFVKASSADTFSGHPVVLSLRPAPSKEGDLPAVHQPAPEHQSIRVAVNAGVKGADKPSKVVFDLVVKGIGSL